jgi:hypothetical protein
MHGSARVNIPGPERRGAIARIQCLSPFLFAWDVRTNHTGDAARPPETAAGRACWQRDAFGRHPYYF